MAAAPPDVCHPGGAPWLGVRLTAAPSSSRDMALGVAPLDPKSLCRVGEEEKTHVLAEVCLLGFP